MCHWMHERTNEQSNSPIIWPSVTEATAQLVKILFVVLPVSTWSAQAQLHTQNMTGAITREARELQLRVIKVSQQCINNSFNGGLVASVCHILMLRHGCQRQLSLSTVRVMWVWGNMFENKDFYKYIWQQDIRDLRWWLNLCSNQLIYNILIWTHLRLWWTVRISGKS